MKLLVGETRNQMIANTTEIGFYDFWHGYWFIYAFIYTLFDRYRILGLNEGFSVKIYFKIPHMHIKRQIELWNLLSINISSIKKSEPTKSYV